MKKLFGLLFLQTFVTFAVFSQADLFNKVRPEGVKEISWSYSNMRLEYPQLAKEKGVAGTVIVMVNVDSTCSIINRRLVKTLGYGCDEAALKSLDLWETKLKELYSSRCKPLKDEKIPVKFILN
jgi:hypothetical protein